MPSSAPPPPPPQSQLPTVNTPSLTPQPLHTAYNQILQRHGQQRADDMFSAAEQARWANRRGIFSGTDDISGARTIPGLHGRRLREQMAKSVEAEKEEYRRWWREKRLRELGVANILGLRCPSRRRRRGSRSSSSSRELELGSAPSPMTDGDRSWSTEPQGSSPPPSLTLSRNCFSSLCSQSPPTTPVHGTPPRTPRRPESTLRSSANCHRDRSARRRDVRRRLPETTTTARSWKEVLELREFEEAVGWGWSWEGDDE